jgi:CHAD domain-containing protein
MRQVGHRSIVAPLAATLAATVAVGVGVALARSERERRAARERRFGLLEDERVDDGLRRIALGQLDLAIEALQGASSGATPEVRVHEARKALKRVRALLRLVRDELGEQAYERESTVVRDTGARLSRARDAAVLLSTLDGLLERHPRKLGRRPGVQRLRMRLLIEQDGAAALALADGARRGGAISELQQLRARVASWELAEEDGIEAIEPALALIYGRGRKRMRRAAQAGGERARGRALHQWRKRVKDLRYAAEILERAAAGKRLRDRIGGKRAKRKRKRRRDGVEAAYIGKLANRADELGELLGEEHDLALLAERVRAEANANPAVRRPGRASRKALLKSIAARRKRLRRRALRDGRRLYEQPTKRFVRRARVAATLSSIRRR